MKKTLNDCGLYKQQKVSHLKQLNKYGTKIKTHVHMPHDGAKEVYVLLWYKVVMKVFSQFMKSKVFRSLHLPLLCCSDNVLKAGGICHAVL